MSKSQPKVQWKAKENFVIALRDVSGSAVIGTSRITGAINDNKAPVPNSQVTTT